MSTADSVPQKRKCGCPPSERHANWCIYSRIGDGYMPSDPPADLAALDESVARINDGFGGTCPWGTCVLKAGHASLHQPATDPRDVILADMKATLARIEATAARIERLTSDSGNGIDVLARPGRPQ